LRGVSAYQTIDLNFINYDNDSTYYVYVYAHTRRGTLDLVRNIEQIARRTDGTKPDHDSESDYWPLAVVSARLQPHWVITAGWRRRPNPSLLPT
jgi:hypothetical protein